MNTTDDILYGYLTIDECKDGEVYRMFFTRETSSSSGILCVVYKDHIHGKIVVIEKHGRICSYKYLKFHEPRFFPVDIF